VLTRLQVTGFKNLIDVDVRFGSFTCIAGANGVGKSNLFDAIRFLSALADRPLIDAARSVRDESGRAGDIRSLFHRVGDLYDDEMSFVAEMIIPSEGADDLGQKARAGITFLRYSLTLAYRREDSEQGPAGLEIRKEELSHINLGEARKNLLFPHSPKWRRSVVKGRRTSPYISTEGGEKGGSTVVMHQDGSGGRPTPRAAAALPRTVLSTAYAAENPTALLARREMQSWRLLQLEPSALRRPDEFTAPARLGSDGGHLAATLDRLARAGEKKGRRVARAPDSRAGTATGSGALPASNGKGSERVCIQVADRLATLIDDVRAVWVDRDDRRELLTLHVVGRDGTAHPARALSDGTMRFLALAVLELDPEAQGVICLEEPENGIHPERIPAMLQLLRDIAADTDEPAGEDNPLRQVIVNTHSPAVVLQVPDDSLLVAELKETVRGKERFKRVTFSCLADTWREDAPEKPGVVPKGQLLAYLNPAPAREEVVRQSGRSNGRSPGPRRVRDRADLQPLLPFGGDDA
jgi:predicted ATPase